MDKRPFEATGRQRGGRKKGISAREKAAERRARKGASIKKRKREEKTDLNERGHAVANRIITYSPR